MAYVRRLYGGGYVVERRWYEMDGCALCVCFVVCAICGGDGLTRRHIGWGGETRAQQGSSAQRPQMCV